MIKIKRHKIKSNKPTFVFIMQFASQPESFKHCFSQLHCLRSCCCPPLQGNIVKSCFLSPCTCVSWQYRFRCTCFQTKNREDLCYYYYQGTANWMGAAHTAQDKHRWPQSNIPCSYTNICVALEYAEQVVRPRPFINA